MKHMFSLSTKLSMTQRSLFALSSRFSFTSKIFVEGLPQDWSHQEIANRFVSVGQIQKVNLVKNSLGKATGKAIVTFSDENAAIKATSVFDNTAVEDMVNRVRPYYDKKGESPRKDSQLLKRRIYLMNLPYDATKQEIEVLVKQFGEVDEIAIPRDR